MKSVRHAILAAIASIAASAHAASFTSESAWLTAVGAPVAAENFDSLAVGEGVSRLPGLGLDVAVLSASLQVFPTVLSTASVGGFSRSAPHVLGNFAPPAVIPGATINFRPTRGGDGVFAFGYWNVGFDDRTQLSFYTASGALIERILSPAVPFPNTNLSFIGIVSQQPAARVEIAGVIGNGQFTIDNLQVRVAPVPEPATWLSLAAGLAVLALGHRLRRLPR